MAFHATTFSFSLQYLGPQMVVIGLLVCLKLPHHSCWHVAIFVVHVGENLEQTLPLVVVGLLFIRQLDVGIHMRCSCCVHMVESSLRHGVKHLVQLGLLNLLLVVEEVVQHHVVHWVAQVDLQLLEFFVCQFLICGFLPVHSI